MYTKYQIIVVGLFCLLFLTQCQDSATVSNEGLNKNGDEYIVVDEKDVTGEVFSVQEYVNWMQDLKNGFRKEKRMDDLDFVLQYKPYEYIVCMEQREEKIHDTLLKSRIDELKGVQYFDLKILLNEQEGELLKYKISSNDQYQKRVNYFAFGMQDDIQLVEGNDTLPCVLYHFERTYDVAPYCTILVGFNLDKNNFQKQKTFLFHDKTFNKGLLKFTFKENRLTNLPKLETI